MPKQFQSIEFEKIVVIDLKRTNFFQLHFIIFAA